MTKHSSKTASRRQKRLLKSIASIRGQDRQNHFDNGGTASDWRGGRHQVQKDQRKEDSKRACRGPQ